MDKFIKLKGKKPVEKWQEPQHQYRIEDVIPWTNNGNPIGWIVPDNLIVVDIDDPALAGRLLENIGVLGNCGIFKTPRGVHLIYSSEGTEKIKQGAKINAAIHGQVDYRVAGKGYIVYPSVEPNREIVIDIPEEPEPLPELFKPVHSQHVLNITDIAMGTRNELLYKHAIRLYNEGMDAPKIIKTINSLLVSQLEENELEKSLASAKKWVIENPLTPKVSRNDKTKLLVELASNACEEFKFDHHHFYRWAGQHWERVNQTVVNRYIYEMVSYNLTAGDLANVVSKLKAMAYSNMESPKGCVNTLSGVYNPETKELRPVKRSDNFTHLINAEVDPLCNTMKLENILEGMTPNMEALKMLLGTILHDDNRITEKAFMLIGNRQGQNGKDTFLTLVESVFGFQQIDFNELGTGFTMANIEGALILADTDFNGRVITQSAVFKKIVSGSTLEAQVKFVQEPKKFISRATIIVNTNMFPVVEQSSVGGFYRRWCVITFPNDFTLDEKRDPLIKIRMSSGEFNNALLKLALDGYELIKQNRYKYPNSRIEEWGDNNNPLGTWIRSEFVQDETKDIECAVVYDMYRQFCEDTGVHRPLGMTSFIRAVKEVYGVTQERVSRQGKRVQILKGLDLYVEPETE